ncbi:MULTISPECIES: alpha/beta fold hydrolase [unclassified Streptomyces]|uniref:alpha/beta fold hydrolase n=1 Tax=unclassified Streptomyces TaxID=2593676 RepID=UPI00380BB5FE
MPRIRRTALSLALAVVTPALAVLPSAASAQAAPASSGVRCQEVRVPVAMTEGGTADQTVAGSLCTPRKGRATTVQVMVPGGNYDRRYWTMAPDSRTPSYEESMQRAGYATLVLDRLGTGSSSRPVSTRYTGDTHSESVHQVLKQLNAGKIAHQRFPRVVLVGHSMGSGTSAKVAIKHPEDMDALVLTGTASQQGSEGSSGLVETGIHPANQDPRWAGAGLDDGYIITKPGERVKWFYYEKTMDPATLAADEAAAQPDAMPSPALFPKKEDFRKIKVPTLVVLGDHDRIVCGGAGGSDCSSTAALQAQENRNFSKAAHVKAVVIEDTGHSINQQLTAPALYTAVKVWDRPAQHR